MFIYSNSTSDTNNLKKTLRNNGTPTSAFFPRCLGGLLSTLWMAEPTIYFFFRIWFASTQNGKIIRFSHQTYVWRVFKWYCFHVSNKNNLTAYKHWCWIIHLVARTLYILSQGSQSIQVMGLEQNSYLTRVIRIIFSSIQLDENWKLSTDWFHNFRTTDKGHD